jgi:C4-dicarboxylate transporter DctQ subunit
MPTALARAHDAVTAVGFFFARLCLVVIVGAYTYETAARYFFAAPSSWSNEAVAYALCIGTFLAMPELTRRRGHIAITFVAETLPAGWTRPLASAVALVSGLVCLTVAAVSLDENVRQYVNDVLIMRVHQIPKIWVSSWITYGFLSSGIYFLRSLADPLRTPDADQTSAARA